MKKQRDRKNEQPKQARTLDEQTLAAVTGGATVGNDGERRFTPGKTY